MNVERPARRRTGARTAVAAVGTTALLGSAAALLLPGASADPVSSDVAGSCVIGSSTVDVTVPVTVDDKIDPVEEGGHETLETRTGVPTLPIEVTIDKLVVTMPVPTQIASTDAVTFSGGNLAGSYELVGSDIVVTFTGPVSSKDIQVPIVTSEHTVASGTGSDVIRWRSFSKLDADTNYGTATCTPKDPGQIVNTTSLHAGPPPTTAPEPAPTTTPSTAPPTGEPPSTPPSAEPPSAPPTTAPTSTVPPTAPPTTRPTAPVPSLPAPLPPSPIPPAVPPASTPTVPGLPDPAEPCPAPGLPPLPVLECPALPAPPTPTTPPLPPAPTVPTVPPIRVDGRIGVRIG